MQYRRVERSGDDLSILGFGCMRLPMKGREIDEPRAIALIREAIDAGVNYIDTAWPYHSGASEPLVGRALQDGYRERVKLATKLPTWRVKTPEDMDVYLNKQLDKLQTDHIDYYLLHALNGHTWDAMQQLGVLAFLDRAKADGRIANAGFSFHGLAEDFTRIVDAYPWVFAQIQYNYLDRAFQAGEAGLKYAAEQGLGVIIMEPLRGGSLGREDAPPAITEIWERGPVRRTPVEWALRWLWDLPEVTLVLSGMNEEAHLRENIQIASTSHVGMLSETERSLVDEAAKTYQSLMKVGCTGCGYCMPCPAGVAIPGCFEEYNQMHMFNQKQAMLFRYALRMCGELTDGKPGYASQCVRCGQCVEHCPQNIAIPDRLAEVAAEMEGPDLAQRVEQGRAYMKGQG